MLLKVVLICLFAVLVLGVIAYAIFSLIRRKKIEALPHNTLVKNFRSRPLMDTPPPSVLPFFLPEEFPTQIERPINQGQCGSCWLFATTTAVSDAIRIFTEEDHGNSTTAKFLKDMVYGYPTFIGETAAKIKASAQSNSRYASTDIINSISPYHTGACLMQATNELKLPPASEPCYGYYIDDTLEYMVNKPLISMLANDAYKGTFVCQPFDMSKVNNFRIGGYKKLSSAEEIDKALRGTLWPGFTSPCPVVAAIYVDDSFKQKWVSGSYGVFTDPSPTPQAPNHAIVILGSTNEYWLCRNSWGTSFTPNPLPGSKYHNYAGYFLVAKGKNAFSIESEAYSFFLKEGLLVSKQ